MIDSPGWVYTIHLHTPLGRDGRNGATHYTGWTTDLMGRLYDHREGRGSKMLACARDRGITWHVGALRRGTPGDERRLKHSHGADRWCWTCQGGK